MLDCITSCGCKEEFENSIKQESQVPPVPSLQQLYSVVDSTTSSTSENVVYYATLSMVAFLLLWALYYFEVFSYFTSKDKNEREHCILVDEQTKEGAQYFKIEGEYSKL